MQINGLNGENTNGTIPLLKKRNKTSFKRKRLNGYAEQLNETENGMQIHGLNGNGSIV